MADSSTVPVVVGVDGSDEALAAADWAARQARRSGRRLRIVHAFEWPMFHVRLGPPPGAPPWAGLTNAARRIVADAAEKARAAAPEIPIEAEHVEGFRRPVLLAEAARAHMVVVGSRGLGSVEALVIGSTGVELAAHARCPVVIVPHKPPEGVGERLVVAVDCSESSRPALEFALAEARTRGVGLRVLLAWQGEGLRAALTSGPPPADHVATEDEARARLAEFTAAYRREHPEVAVEETVVRGSPRQVLIEASADAALLVVGSRGYGGFRGMLLGSVSQAALQYAECPVAVVPPPR